MKQKSLIKKNSPNYHSRARYQKKINNNYKISYYKLIMKNIYF